MSKIIQLNHVSRTFNTNGREFTALEEVNLSVEEGEFLAVVGKSGSGKSTLLNILTGIDRPTEGAVFVGGKEINRLNESELASWRGENVGIVFQFFQLIPTLTILENMLLAMEFGAKIPKEKRLERASALLSQVGILEHAEKMPSGLSGGEQQRAAIARALANDPPLLVADEPTGNLDSKTAETIHHLFEDLAAEGKTIIFVTHEQEIQSKLERVVTLSDGRVISDQIGQHGVLA